MATTAALEWTSGDSRVVLDILPIEVLGALMRLRTRLLQRIDDLPRSEAERPTRCTAWTVVDLANHIADATGWASAVTAAAARGESSQVFAGFHVRRTPKQLTDAAPRDLDAARARLHAAMAESLGQVAEVVGIGQALTETPVGLQPFPVAALHILWDTWLHERDLCLPAGVEPPQHEDETRLCAIYTLRMVGVCAVLMGSEVSATVALRGGTGVTLRLDASPALIAVRVVDEPPQLSGDAATMIDALTGRGDLDAALDGPAELRTALNPLCAVLAGR